MNCLQCRESLVDHIAGLLGEPMSREIADHLGSCAACRSEAEQIEQLHARLRGDAAALGGAALAQPVMDRIFRTTTHQLRRKTMFKRIIRIGAGLGVAAAIAVVAMLLFAPPAGTPTANAAEILAGGAKAAANLKSVHIIARMRSAPREDIEFIGTDLDFISVEMWKQFEPTALWRIEKPGRVIVMDGKQLVTWVKPDRAFRRGALQNTHAFWTAQLLDVDRMLDIEHRNATREGVKLTTAEERAADGKRQTVVTVEAKAQGDFSASDWMKNRTLSQSDNRRVYRFDAESKRLEGLDVWVHADGKDVLIFQITKIEYNPPLDGQLFALDLPKDVQWIGEMKPGPADEKYAKMTPKEVATAFFEAISKEDWDEVNSLMGMKIDDKLGAWGGLKIISIGEPFKSGLFPGVFVPYEVQLKNGETHKFNLAVRNDTPGKRWKVDGGL